MVPIEGGEPTEIVNALAGAESVDVSPDGDRLMFVSSETQNQFVIMVCDLPMCTNRQRLPPPTNFSPAELTRWTPDGQSIAYVDTNGSNIWSQPLDGGPPRQITHFSDRRVKSFAWSRDGKRLAVIRTTTTNDIVLFKAEEVGEGPAEAGHYDPLGSSTLSCSNHCGVWQDQSRSQSLSPV